MLIASGSARALPTIEEAARQATSAVVIGNGGGGDCLVGILAGSWLRSVGVERILYGGIGCQWWPEPGPAAVDGPTAGGGTDPRNEVGLGGSNGGDHLVRVIAPDFYDPRSLYGARPLGEFAALVGPEAHSHGRVPHESVLAEHGGGEAFVLSHLGGSRGAVAGLRAVVEYAGADLLLAVDVGSDCLSTGREIRPAMTVLADHLTFSALLGQDVPSYFCLAGYGADAEMEIEELERNFGDVVRAGGLRGAFAPSSAALDQLELLQSKAFDPVGNLVVKAGRGEFGLHCVLTASPWGQVARLGPASIPVWVFDPQVVLDTVAVDVKRIQETSTLEEAEWIYAGIGRLPESRITRSVDFRRTPGR